MFLVWLRGLTLQFDSDGDLGENEVLPLMLRLKSGPVAQLGARFHGMEEVVGSIPTRSTKHLPACSTPPFSSVGKRRIGCHASPLQPT